MDNLARTFKDKLDAKRYKRKHKLKFMTRIIEYNNSDIINTYGTDKEGNDVAICGTHKEGAKPYAVGYHVY